MSLFTLKTKDQFQYGPVEIETLRAWLREGRVLPEDHIYDHARMKWVEASQLPQIMDLLRNNGAIPKTETLIPNSDIIKDPMTRTDIEDPLTRVEKQVAANLKKAKTGGVSPAQKEIRAPISKLKLTPNMVRTDLPNATTTKGAIAGQAPKPPTVLDRITKIFLGPFVRKKPDASRKHSQRVK